MPQSTERKWNTSLFELYFALNAAAVMATLLGGAMGALLPG